MFFSVYVLKTHGTITLVNGWKQTPLTCVMSEGEIYTEGRPVTHCNNIYGTKRNQQSAGTELWWYSKVLGGTRKRQGWINLVNGDVFTKIMTTTSTCEEVREGLVGRLRVTTSQILD